MCIVTNNAKAYVNRSANKFKKRLRLFLSTMSAYTNVSSDLPTMQMRACLSMSYKFTGTQEQLLYCGQPTRLIIELHYYYQHYNIKTKKKKKKSRDSTKFSRVFKGFHQKTQQQFVFFFLSMTMHLTGRQLRYIGFNSLNRIYLYVFLCFFFFQFLFIAMLTGTSC